MKMISGYLGPDLKVEGDVESKESIRIDGEYKGNINSQREVTIGPSGDVEGEIHAPIIRVSGSVKGSLSRRIPAWIARPPHLTHPQVESKLVDQKLIISQPVYD